MTVQRDSELLSVITAVAELTRAKPGIVRQFSGQFHYKINSTTFFD